MLKQKLKPLVLVCGFIFFITVFSSAGIANTEMQIRAYIQQHFAHNLIINDAQIAQLAWALAHVRPTPDLHMHKAQDALLEVDRALARLYCAQLLRTGNRAAYNKFVAAQVGSGIQDVLSFATFTKLSKHIQSIAAQDYELLETAAILSAVSLSKPAAMLAQDALLDLPTHDKTEFLAATLRNNSNIYPLLAQKLQNTDAAKKMLYILFPPQTNFRHMLYAENGIGMFKYLRNMIRHGFIDRNSLDLWYAHWIINIAGFRGHLMQNGSMYLNETTAQAMLKLQELITQMLAAPNFDPLVPYLEYRAELLGLQHLPRAQRLFVAHLACMLRLYNTNEGHKLYLAVEAINPHALQTTIAHFNRGLIDPNQLMHLHMPALLGNVRQTTNGDLNKTLTLVLNIYNKIMLAANTHADLPCISFEILAAAPDIIKLLQEQDVYITFAADGVVLLNQA